MSRFIRRNAVGLVALFIALSGSAYAAVSLPANSVGTVQLRDHAVTLSKLDPKAVRQLHNQLLIATHESFATFAQLTSFDNPVDVAPLTSVLPGAYDIRAVLSLENVSTQPENVQCQLAAGSDVDTEVTSLGRATGFSQVNQLVLEVTHRFATPGTIGLTCIGGDASDPVDVSNVRVTAQQVGVVTDTTFAGPLHG